MKIQVPWDRQETALLIDAYLRVKNKKLSQQEAVREVSELLRRRAILSGREIDDAFRNTNGVGMQMRVIGGLIDDRPSGLYSATKMFNVMVALYRNNPTAFYEVLNQAKEECAMQLNLQEEFFDWLKGRVSSAQLSEFYTLCKDIESFCISKRILAQPLFETANIVVIQSVIDTIKTNRMFQFKHFRHLGKMRKVMDFYMTFLREFPSHQNEEGSKKAPANSEVAARPAESNEVKNTTTSNAKSIVAAVPEESAGSAKEEKRGFTESKASPITAIPANGVSATEDSSDATLVWSFANDNVDFSNTIPSAITYFGEKRKVQGWADALAKIVCAMQEDFPSIIRGVVGYRFVSVGKVVLTGIAGIGRFSKPAALNNGLYIETNCSPDEIVSIVRVLMDKCNMDYNNIGIHYQKTVANGATGKPAWQTKDVISVGDELEGDEAISNLVEKNDRVSENVSVVASADEGKAAFENWLITGAGLALHSAKSYASAINVAGQYSVRLGFSEKELSLIQDAEQVYQITLKLLANPEFAQLNDGQHNRYRAALTKYWVYCKALSGKVAVSAPVLVVSEQKDAIKKNRIAFLAWAQSQQMQETAVRAYLSDINKCSEFAQENNYMEEEHLLLIQDANTLEQVFLEMRKDYRFAEFNNARQKRPVSAMNKLIAFRRATAAVGENQAPVVSVPATPIERPIQKPSASIATTSIDSQVKERYAAVLAEKFADDGFRPEKAIDRNRFRVYYGEMFGEELVEDDERLVGTLMKVGTLRDERIFVKDESEQKDLIEEINATIMETLEGGASYIHLDCLFARFQEQLAEMLHIYNVDSLKSVLPSSGKHRYFKRHNYLFGYDRKPAPAKDVIGYMEKAHLPVTYSEIESALWFIPLDKIKQTLATTPSIVNVASGTYLYAPNLPVSESEVQQIAELISHALLQRNYISDVELMQLIEEQCPSVLMNTSDYPVRGLRNALAYLLREKFSFRGAIISGKDEEISMAKVFSDFCQRSERLTVDELKQFADELNVAIYWDSVYSEMVRVNRNEFVRRDQIHFDVEWTDAVLDNLIQGAYAPIKTINLFLHFPAIDVPWNSFVLESYVAHCSKKFKLLHANYTAADCCGAIVRQDAGIFDYRALIVDVLTNNAGWKTKEEALQLLVDLGYQQRRSYSDIEKVMQEAKAKLQASK